MLWRYAAELYSPNTQAAEYCWEQWERIMHLPRRLAGPVSAVCNEASDLSDLTGSCSMRPVDGNAEDTRDHHRLSF
jgi:hypothetical protein